VIADSTHWWPFEEVVFDTTRRATKIQRSAYLGKGLIPVIDQGQEEIAGYTDAEYAAYPGALPVVLFGDHTRALKLADRPFAAGADGIKVLEPRSDLNAKFLWYYLRSRPLPNDGYSRHFKHLRELKIPVPSMDVQRRTIDLLWRAENIFRMRREAEAKAKEIIPALFVDMFGDLESDSRRWEVRNLADVTFFQEGPGIMAVDFRETGVPLIRLSGLQGSRVSLSGCNYIDEAKVSKRWSQFRLAKDDILVLTSATFGKPAVVDSEAEGAIFYTGIIRFRPLTDGLSRTYLRAFLGSPLFLQQARKLASGSVIKHFGPSHLRQMLIPIPSLQAQERFGGYLPEAERIVAEQSTARSLAQEIFQSLLARVFGGI
jgi:type I restriction enzyme, S subunit